MCNYENPSTLFKRFSDQENSKVLYPKTLIFFQAQIWIYAFVQPQEGPLQKGWILLEEEEGWQDHQRGPHEAQGPGHGGQFLFILDDINL